MTGTEYAVDDQPAPPGPGSPVNRRVVMVAAVAVVVLIVGVIVAFRQDLPPVAVPAEPITGPAVRLGDEFGVDGIGNVRLGMSEADFERLYDGQVDTVATDVEHGCRQLSGADQSPLEGRSVWVWARDGVVAAVGVRAWFGGVPSAVGPTIGGPMDQADPALAGWQWDESSEVPVARLKTQDRVVTVADVDVPDGATAINYASTGTEDGDVCAVSADQFPYLTPGIRPDSSVIDGTTLGGLALGAAEADVAASPGWSRDIDTDATCNVYVDGHGGQLYVRGVVTGLAAEHVVGGPAIGQTVADALDGVDGQLVSSTTTDDGQYRTTVIEVADGRVFTLLASFPYAIVAGIDDIVRPDRGPGSDVIERIELGQACDNPFS